MIKASVKEARQNFSHLLDQVENGEEIVISRRGNIIAHIIPHATVKSNKKLPSLKKFREKIKTKGKSLSKMIHEERSLND